MVRLFLAGALIASVVGVGAAVDCASNITISNAEEAKELVDSCTTLQGDLILAEDLAESIELDGLEIIQGDLKHEGCDIYDDDCEIPEPFNISSSTLREVHGSVYFYYFHGLEGLMLPELEIVNSSISLSLLHNTTHIDLTNLRWIAHFSLNAERLETLLVDGIRGFHSRGWGDGGVEIWNAGQVESLDGFFRNPLDPKMRDDWGQAGGVVLYPGAIPMVRNLTFGWTRVPYLKIGGGQNSTNQGLDVTLGGPDTTEQHIGELQINLGVKSLSRGSALNNLTVDSLDVSVGSSILDLALPFDRLSELSISPASLETLELPEAAEDWHLERLFISDMGSLNLTEYDGDGRKIWHWPKEPIDELYLVGNLTNEFVGSLLKQDAQVASLVDLTDLSGQLDCEILEGDWNATGHRPDAFDCYAADSSSVRMGMSSLTIALAALVVCIIL